MTKLSFFGGISTIGGNCIILEEDGQRIMLDNGMCFSDENNYFKNFLNARGGNNTRDFTNLKLLPPINGIYGKDVLKDVGFDIIDPDGQYLLKGDLESFESYLQKNGKPFIDGILITHAHIDHFRNIQFMHPDIPIYCSQITYALFKIISELTFQDYMNFIYSQLGNYGEKSYFPGAIKKENKRIARKFIVMEPSKSYQIGGFKVIGYLVDHSLVGAMAFQILTNNGKQIVYTGDIRFHGHQQERENSDHFVEEVSKSATDALICEGTKVIEEKQEKEEKQIGEDDVLQESLKIIKQHKNYRSQLILVSFPWKNISRFLTVYQIAKELKRTLVILPKLAYLLHNLGSKLELNIKDILHNKDIRIYLPRKRSMLYSLGDYISSKSCISYDVNWEKRDDYKVNLYTDLYGDDILVKAFEIHNHPEKFMLHLQFYDITELIDIQPPQGCLFFSMKTEPYDEEGEIEDMILQEWMGRFELQLERIHASGHAPKKVLFEMIDKIDPKILFPVHTEHPELFKMNSAIKDLILGKEYTI